VVLEGGTLTSSAAGFGRSPVRRHSGGVWNTDRAEHGVVGTLLGPEGADRLPGEPGAGSVISCQGRSSVVPPLSPRGWAGLAVEGDRCLVVR
jgi:hypothetical protein